MTSAHSTKMCACPNGSYGKKHTPECYESQLAYLRAGLLTIATGGAPWPVGHAAMILEGDWKQPETTCSHGNDGGCAVCYGLEPDSAPSAAGQSTSRGNSSNPAAVGADSPSETTEDPDDAPDSTVQFTALVEDAKNWRALRNCARITSMGSAGLHDPDKLVRPDAHVTLNFWTHGVREPEAYPREWLDQFVMKVRRLTEKASDDPHSDLPVEQA